MEQHQCDAERPLLRVRGVPRGTFGRWPVATLEAAPGQVTWPRGNRTSEASGTADLLPAELSDVSRYKATHPTIK